MFSASQISKYFGSVAVFRNVSLRISPGERIGVIGRNGAGKTTLLRCLAGLLDLDEGQLHMPRTARIAYLSQREPLPGDRDVTTEVESFRDVDESRSWICLPVYEAALSVFRDLQEQERTLRELEQAMASGDPVLLARYGEALETFERAGGYEYRHRTGAVLTGLGFSPDQWEQRVDALSGGELMRLALARLLLAEPDLALLDEPTNHLDLEGVEWLEGFLQRFPGAVVVVSHDRRFLDRVTQRTWELEGGSLVDYPAPFSGAMELKAARLKRLAKERAAYEREKGKLEHFIARFRAGTRASQAKDRQRKLERLEAPPPVDTRSSREIRLQFASGRSLDGAVVCLVQELALGYPGRAPLLKDVNIHIPAGARIGLVGPNGAGKSTLLKGLAGELPFLEGFIEWGRGVQLGYFSQDGRELDDYETVLEAVLSRHPMTPQQAREALAAFLFTGPQVDQTVGTLSGGERARLSLLLLMLSGANVLLLDEPTNHLDLPSREALENALAAYDGTLVVVSHDRYFLDRVTTATWWIEDGTVRMWDGSYSAAREAMLNEAGRNAVGFPLRSGDRGRLGSGEGVGQKASSSRSVKSGNSARRRNAGAELATLETSIEALEEERAALEASLAHPETYQGGDVADVVNRYRQVEEELSALYQRWEALVEELGD